jgi:hypothetical protein
VAAFYSALAVSSVFFSSFCPFLKSLVVNFSARSPSAHRAGVLCCAVFPLFFSDAPKMLVSWWWERAAEGAERNGTERSRAWAPGRAGGASASVALLQVGAVPESLFSPPAAVAGSEISFFFVSNIKRRNGADVFSLSRAHDQKRFCEMWDVDWPVWACLFVFHVDRLPLELFVSVFLHFMKPWEKFQQRNSELFTCGELEIAHSASCGVS